MYWVAGNHDVLDPPTPETLALYRSRFGEENYSFQVESTHFAVINSSACRSLSKVDGEWDKLVEFLASSGDHWDLMALTGDIVSNASRHNLLLAHDQLSPYAEQLVVAPGNHDVGTTNDNALRDVFEEVFGPTYSAIELADALLVFVDLSVEWTLDLEQRHWLEDLLVDPPEDLPAAGEAARTVARDARAEGAWIFGGGVLRQQAAIVGTDGSVTQGPQPGTKAVLGGFSILELAMRDEALHWAGRFAAACRCCLTSARSALILARSSATSWACAACRARRACRSSAACAA